MTDTELLKRALDRLEMFGHDSSCLALLPPHKGDMIGTFLGTKHQCTADARKALLYLIQWAGHNPSCKSVGLIITEAEKASFAYCNCEYPAIVAMMLKALHAADAPPHGPWIPVSQRLPEIGADVWAWDGHDQFFASYKQPSGEPWPMWYSTHDGENEVSHWMTLADALPDPPTPTT